MVSRALASEPRTQRRRPSRRSPSTGDRSAAAARSTVDVAGAVKRPASTCSPRSERVEDALERAGGPTRRADLSQINRAAKLEDGRQILVPARAAEPRPPPRAGGAGARRRAPEQPINLNTATLEQLDTLDGVGPATAQKILDYRDRARRLRLGRRARPDPGIGEKRLAALRERVRV